MAVKFLPLPFSIDEVNAIVRLAQVDKYMRRPYAIDSRSFDVPNLGGHSADASKLYIDRGLQKWQWQGQSVTINRFVILREHFTMALIDALRELQGRDLQELLIRMRMVNKDDSPDRHSYSVGVSVVAYAVRLQYAANGLRAFERFTEDQAKPLEKCINPPPDLRSMS